MSENPLRFNPASQKNQKTSRPYHGRRKEWLCGPHRAQGWLKGNQACPGCLKENSPQGGIRIITGECYKGWYEHLGPQPVYIESKTHLYRECRARGLEARSLISGNTMKRPRGA